jgi:hypothetical protein
MADEIIAAMLAAAIIGGKQVGLDHDGAKRAVSFYREVLAILTEAERLPSATFEETPTV